MDGDKQLFTNWAKDNRLENVELPVAPSSDQISADGKLVAAGDLDVNIHVWSLDGLLNCRYDHSHDSGIPIADPVAK